MTDLSDQRLVELLHRDPQAGWRAFVDRYSATLLAIIRRAGVADRDEVMELYVLTCERLTERDCERLRRHDPSRGGFDAWLPTVVRHVAIDWLRSRAGRRRLFECIRRLSAHDQQIFQLRYWQELSPAAILTALSSTGTTMTLADVFDALERIEAALSERQRAELVAWTTRTRPILSLDANADGGPIDVAAPAPTPEEALDTRRTSDALNAALKTLPPEDAAIVRLKFVQGLSNREIERAVRSAVSGRRIAAILEHLRRALAAGVRPARVGPAPEGASR